MRERLARWLRVLGADVASAPRTTADHELVRQAAAEGRVLLTRDRWLAAEHAAGELTAAHVVGSAAPLEQRAEVVARFDVVAGELFTRCLLCNAPLEPAPPAASAPPAGARP